MITKVFIKDKHYGWDQPITVQRKDLDGEVIFCDHAGADIEEQNNQIDRIDAPDIVWTDKVWVCNKCKAYRFEYDNYWNDAPFEGLTQ